MMNPTYRNCRQTIMGCFQLGMKMNKSDYYHMINPLFFFLKKESKQLVNELNEYH